MIVKIIFLLILFLANSIQTITGFAGTLLALPVTIRLVGIEDAKIILNVFTLAGSIIVAIQNRKFINYKLLVKINIVMIIGMAAGMQIYKALPMDFLLKVLGVVVILVVLQKVLVKGQKDLPKMALNIVLIMTGIIHGMFLSGGALLVIYMLQVLKNKDEFRAEISATWVVTQGIMVVYHMFSGAFTKERILLSGFSIIPLILSIIVGNFIYKKIEMKHFLNITYVLLLISGISLFF